VPTRQRAQANTEATFLRELAGIDEATTAAAKSGDTSAARLVYERVHPARKPESPPCVVPGFDQDVDTASAAVVSMVAAGQISVEKGGQLLDILAKRAEIAFAQQVVEQLARLKANLKRHGLAPLLPALTAESA